MQGQQVKRVLQFVARFEDRMAHRGWCVGLVVESKPVRLVVRDVPATFVFHDEIDETLQHAIHAIRRERRAGCAVQRVLADDAVEGQRIHAPRLEQKLQFGAIARWIVEGAEYEASTSPKHQWRAKEAAKPIGERIDGALPATPLASPRDGVAQALWIGGDGGG